VTPRSSQDFEHSSPGHHLDGAPAVDNGLGNLADELGDVWDEDEEGMEGEYLDDESMDMQHDDPGGIGVALDHDGSIRHNDEAVGNAVRDSGVAMSSPSSASKGTLSPAAAIARVGNGRRHQRQRSLYDGSDYGDSSDLEENEGIPAGLERQLAAVESLVRRGLEQNGSAADEVVQRTVERLRDLGSQTSIETGATRYVDTHGYLSIYLSSPTYIYRINHTDTYCAD
jgi:hypothetical protein